MSENNILLEANDVVNGPRAKDYGEPSDNWDRTARIFNAMTGLQLTTAEAVKFAIAMKLSRLAMTPDHRDSIIDLAGYSWVYSKVIESSREGA